MELTEPIASINSQLIDLFGIDTITGLPVFRVVWSEDQFEKRKTDYSDAGIRLLQPEVRLLPKYRQWVQQRYVLERLTLVPEIQQDELQEKMSYEPLWVFETQKGIYLPPRLDVAKIVIDTVYAAQGKRSLAKYKEDTSPEAAVDRVNKLQKDMFGNETDTGDALAYGEGVSVPHNYQKVSES